MALVSADLIEREGVWDPRIFCGPMLPMLRLAESWSLSERGAIVLEGQRWPPLGDEIGPIYRLSNLGDLELHLESEHCVSPTGVDERCVRAGDIIVTKAAPVRAAIASPSVFRHPVDANCYLVRGLDLADGTWFALCVNQPAFGDYLVRKSGAAIVPRVRMDVLANAWLPQRPAGVESLAFRMMDCLDHRLQSEVELFRFLADVRAAVASHVPDSPGVNAQPVATWCRFYSPADIGDSLVPGHVAVNGYQQYLQRDAGWSPIHRLLGENRSGGNRVTEAMPQIRTLQLSDVGDDLTVHQPDVRSWRTSSRRVFADPVQENEVLLSALVTRPRVAFAGTKPKPEVFPTDHWHRLRFRETPGAWALVLSDPAIHEQLSRLAIGSVQQFAPPWTIRKLVLPDIPLEIRIKWDAFLRRWQQRRLEREDQWRVLLTEAYQLLRETHRDCGPWTLPLAAIKSEEALP
ncbi:MAG: hypothetical protein GXY83_16645 [Rhodopirellula sp.]|nr:hypothetical protein [Rhodopirellula sp.]